MQLPASLPHLSSQLKWPCRPRCPVQENYEKLEKIGEGRWLNAALTLVLPDGLCTLGRTQLHPLPSRRHLWQGVQSARQEHREAGGAEEDASRGRRWGGCTLGGGGGARKSQYSQYAGIPTERPGSCWVQMEEEGVPSTTLREISLLQMLSESNHIVK